MCGSPRERRLWIRPGQVVKLIFSVRVQVPFGVEKVVESAPGRGRKAVIEAHSPVEQAAGVLGAAAGFGVVDFQADSSFRS